METENKEKHFTKEQKDTIKSTYKHLVYVMSNIGHFNEQGIPDYEIDALSLALYRTYEELFPEVIEELKQELGFYKN